MKVNPAMLTTFDTHPNSYFLASSGLPNVQFIHPSTPSAEIIDMACSVATLTGIEGAVFDKPGFPWGRMEFEVVDTVYPFQPSKVREQLQQGASGNLPYYVQACFNLGLRLDVRLLCEPRETMTREQAAEFESQMSGLEKKILEYVTIETKTKTTEVIV